MWTNKSSQVQFIIQINTFGLESSASYRNLYPVCSVFPKNGNKLLINFSLSSMLFSFSKKYSQHTQQTPVNTSPHEYLLQTMPVYTLLWNNLHIQPLLCNLKKGSWTTNCHVLLWIITSLTHFELMGIPVSSLFWLQRWSSGSSPQCEIVVTG
jgi:hypothetical protein